MDEREILLSLHILGAFLIVAGAGAETVLGIRSGMTTNTRVMHVIGDLQVLTGRFVITPGALIALVFGTTLIVRFDNVYEFSDAWISAAYVFWLLAMAVATGYLLPHAAKLRDRASALIAEGVEESEELKELANEPRAMMLGIGNNVILLIFIYLMVAKPGA